MTRLVNSQITKGEFLGLLRVFVYQDSLHINHTCGHFACSQFMQDLCIIHEVLQPC